MPKMVFINLPVADVARSTAFYEAIGATRDPRFSNEKGAMMTLSDTIRFMLLSHDFYQGFVPDKAIADARATSEVLICLSEDSRDGVDAICARVAAAGGRVDIRPAQDMPFMYGRSFEDPDGHVFEPMWMDLDAMAAMNAAQAA